MEQNLYLRLVIILHITFYMEIHFILPHEHKERYKINIRIQNLIQMLTSKI